MDNQKHLLTSTIKLTSKQSIQAWGVWFLAALFYGFEFFQRVAPSMMINNLMKTFAVDAAALGLLGSIYFYTYAIMQLPVGTLLDKYGARKLLALAALVVAGGSLLFATSQQFWQAELARLLIGAGSAFAFIGCLKLATIWFPANLFPIIVGLTNMLGVVGALFAERPLANFIEHLGWRNAFYVAALIGVMLCVLIFIFVRNRPNYSPIPTHAEIKAKQLPLTYGLKCMIKTPQSWLIAAFAGLMVVPIIAFGEFWAVPFIQTTHHMPKETAATMIMFIFIGIAVGGPFNGFLSTRLRRRKIIMVVGNIGALAVLCTIIYITDLPAILLALCLFLLGFFASTMLLSFSLNHEIHPPEISATTIAFTNMFIMICGAVFQPLIGILLDSNWMGLMQHGVRVFSQYDYQLSLSILPACLILSLIILFNIQDTHKLLLTRQKRT